MIEPHTLITAAPVVAAGIYGLYEFRKGKHPGYLLRELCLGAWIGMWANFFFLAPEVLGRVNELWNEGSAAAHAEGNSILIMLFFALIFTYAISQFTRKIGSVGFDVFEDLSGGEEDGEETS